MRLCWRPILLLALFALAAPVWPQPTNPVSVFSFATAADEARYRALIDEFRCPKCLNTNLSGSNAPIAQDLRRTVYRLAIEQRLSDAEVRAYLQQRYGDFVLYNPPLRPATYLLWFGPLLLLLVGIVAWRRTVRSAQREEAVSLDADAQARLAALLRQDRS